jgi:hypothetical protein
VKTEFISTAAASFRLIGASLLLAALAGCCVSYSRTGGIERRPDGSPTTDALVAVIRRAVQPPLEIKPLPADGTDFRVSEGREGLNVGVDTANPGISIGWDWHTHSDFVARVQSAVEREFAATFGTPLQFRNNPCGWFGP